MDRPRLGAEAERRFRFSTPGGGTDSWSSIVQSTNPGSLPFTTPGMSAHWFDVPDVAPGLSAVGMQAGWCAGRSSVRTLPLMSSGVALRSPSLPISMEELHVFAEGLARAGHDDRLPEPESCGCPVSHVEVGGTGRLDVQRAEKAVRHRLAIARARDECSGRLQVSDCWGCRRCTGPCHRCPGLLDCPLVPTLSPDELIGQASRNV